MPNRIVVNELMKYIHRSRIPIYMRTQGSLAPCCSGPISTTVT
jgi:hypothetical protein